MTRYFTLLSLALFIFSYNCIAADTTSPDVVDVTFSTNVVDLTSGTKTFSVTVTAEDEESSITEAFVSFVPPEGVPYGHARSFYISNGWQKSEVDNTYSATLNVTFDVNNTVKGKWSIAIRYLKDAVGNSTSDFDYFIANRLLAKGINPYITVISPLDIDISPPQFSALALSSHDIDTSNGAQIITVNLQVTEANKPALSTIELNDPNGKTHTIDFYSNDWSETHVDGLFSATKAFTFTSDAVSGIWHAGVIRLIDSFNNYGYPNLTAQKLQLAGFNPLIRVNVTEDEVLDLSLEVEKQQNVTLGEIVESVFFVKGNALVKSSKELEFTFDLSSAISFSRISLIGADMVTNGCVLSLDFGSCRVTSEDWGQVSFVLETKINDVGEHNITASILSASKFELDYTNNEVVSTFNTLNYPASDTDFDGDGIQDNDDDDKDSDGIPNVAEAFLGLNALDHNDGALDMDGDGYSNTIEYLIGSDVTVSQDGHSRNSLFMSLREFNQLPVQSNRDFLISSERVLYSDSSLEYQFTSAEETFLMSFNGPFKAGVLGWADNSSTSMTRKVYINGESVGIESVSLGDWVWRYVLIEPGYAEVEIRFTSTDKSSLYIDALSLPLLKFNGDFDGDEKADIFMRNQEDGRNQLLRMDGMSILETLDVAPIRNTSWEIAGKGDFNGDGKADLFWRNKESGANTIFEMDGATVASSDATNPVFDTDWQVKGVEDFDGDGKSDILWRHGVSGEVVIFLMDGHEVTLSQGVRIVDDLNWEVAAVGDVNNDGQGDIVWRHKMNGRNIVWYMNGATITEAHVLRTVNTHWLLAGLGDIDGNGSDDIIWRHKTDGRNFVHLMNEEGRFMSNRLINIVPESSWFIADVLDLNGDGKDDLFWRNQDSGRTYIHLLDGANILERGFSQSISPDWQNVH